DYLLVDTHPYYLVEAAGVHKRMFRIVLLTQFTELDQLRSQNISLYMGIICTYIFSCFFLLFTCVYLSFVVLSVITLENLYVFIKKKQLKSTCCVSFFTGD